MLDLKFDFYQSIFRENRSNAKKEVLEILPGKEPTHVQSREVFE